MDDLSSIFIRNSSRYLRDTYLPRLSRALETLPAGDLWWRPHDGALSFGNILLHLEGNVRQWLLSGMGGEPTTAIARASSPSPEMRTNPEPRRCSSGSKPPSGARAS